MTNLQPSLCPELTTRDGGGKRCTRPMTILITVRRVRLAVSSLDNDADNDHHRGQPLPEGLHRRHDPPRRKVATSTTHQSRRPGRQSRQRIQRQARSAQPETATLRAFLDYSSREGSTSRDAVLTTAGKTAEDSNSIELDVTIRDNPFDVRERCSRRRSRQPVVFEKSGIRVPPRPFLHAVPHRRWRPCQATLDRSRGIERGPPACFSNTPRSVVSSTALTMSPRCRLEVDRPNPTAMAGNSDGAITGSIEPEASLSIDGSELRVDASCSTDAE